MGSLAAHPRLQRAWPFVRRSRDFHAAFGFDNPQEPLSIIQSRMTIITALLFIGAAAVLFGSNALDELCGSQRFSSGPSGWDSVSAPESNAISLTVRSLPDKAQLLFLHRWGRVGGWISTGAAALAWYIFLVAAVWLWRKGLQELESAKRAQSSNNPFAALIVIAYVSMVVGYVGYFVAAFLLLFVAALVAALPIALPLAIQWKQPARFLILRPFNRSHLSRTLRQILRRELAPMGHCYTLADADIRVPLWLRLPLVMGQLSFSRFANARSRRPRTFRNSCTQSIAGSYATSTGVSARVRSSRSLVSTPAGVRASRGLWQSAMVLSWT